MASHQRLRHNSTERGSVRAPLRLAWDRRLGPDAAAEATALARTATQDELFLMLDGVDAILGGDQWRLEVYGVVDEPGSRWLQLGLAGPRRHMVTLRIGPGEGAESALARLRAWLAEWSISTAAALSFA